MNKSRALLEESIRLAASGKSDQALQKIKEGIRVARINSDERWLPLLFKNAGILREQRGELLGAKREYKRSFEIDSSDPYLHYTLALVSAKLGQMLAADRYCNSGLDLASKIGDKDLIAVITRLKQQIKPNVQRGKK